MDEEIKAQLIPIIEGTKEGLAKAVDFLCEQSPILVKEILWWHGVSSAILLLASVLVLCCLYRMRRKSYNTIKDSWDDGPIPTLGISLAYAVGGMFGFIGCIEGWDWLKILIAPRLFLLEFMKDAIA